MRDTYKAVEVYEPGRLRPVERSVSEPGAGQVRIRLEACGICPNGLSVTILSDDVFGFGGPNKGRGVSRIRRAATSRERNCLSMAASHKCRPLIARRFEVLSSSWST